MQSSSFSSLPSPQLLSPSHLNRLNIHFPFWHAKVLIGQMPMIFKMWQMCRLEVVDSTIILWNCQFISIYHLCIFVFHHFHHHNLFYHHKPYWKERICHLHMWKNCLYICYLVKIRMKRYFSNMLNHIWRNHIGRMNLII